MRGCGQPATDVFPDDTKEMEAIAAGQCDVGIVNTYYYGRLMKKKPELGPLALFWPNQKDRGVHVNVPAPASPSMPRHRAAAVKLLEWLSSEKERSICSPTPTWNIRSIQK